IRSAAVLGHVLVACVYDLGCGQDDLHVTDDVACGTVLVGTYARAASTDPSANRCGGCAARVAWQKQSLGVERVGKRLPCDSWLHAGYQVDRVDLEYLVHRGHLEDAAALHRHGAPQTPCARASGHQSHFGRDRLRYQLHDVLCVLRPVDVIRHGLENQVHLLREWSEVVAVQSPFHLVVCGLHLEHLPWHDVCEAGEPPPRMVTSAPN